jgi:hypothetical protein
VFQDGWDSQLLHLTWTGRVNPPCPAQASQGNPAYPTPGTPRSVDSKVRRRLPCKGPPRSRVVLSTVWQGATPPMPFNEPGCSVHIRRISCSFSSSNEVLFSFPLRYLFAIGYHAFIFSLGWPAPPLFSQHFQANLLTDKPLASLAYQVACNALCDGISSRCCKPSSCGTYP